MLEGADMVFVTAGMGGGTGSGASPVIADVARSTGALTIGVVTRPFTFEGTQRRRVSESASDQLMRNVDTLIVIPNDRLLQLADKSAGINDAFRTADDVLRQGIQGISELITIPGLINLDFADVRSVMMGGGAALMAIGTASGENRASEAAKKAIHSALLDVSIDGAQAILYNIKGGNDLSLNEINEAAEIIRANTHPEANIIFGAVVDPDMQDEIHLTVIATGFDRPSDAMDQSLTEATYGSISGAFPNTNSGRPAGYPPQRQEPSRPPQKQEPQRPPQRPDQRPDQRPNQRPDQRPEPKPEPPHEETDYSVRTFDRNDLDIPAFLRRNRNNGR